jgi:hypothetical protein
MKEFIRLGTQFIGYRDYADKLKGIPILIFRLERVFLCYFAVILPSFILLESLSEANKRADDLALKLEQNEKAREKAELNFAAVEGLQKRLHEAENALSESTTRQTAREELVIARLESQNRRLVSKYSNHPDPS